MEKRVRREFMESSRRAHEEIAHAVFAQSSRRVYAEEHLVSGLVFKYVLQAHHCNAPARKLAPHTHTHTAAQRVTYNARAHKSTNNWKHAPMTKVFKEF